MSLGTQQPTKQEIHFNYVQKRLLLPLAIILLILFSGYNTALVIIQKSSLNNSSQKLLDHSVNELSFLLDEQANSLTAFLKMLTRDEQLRRGLRNEDSSFLYTNYKELFAQLRGEHKITHFYIHRSDRINLLRFHEPGRYGDLINRFTALEAERTGQVASGIELGPLGTFTLRTIMPIQENGKLIGYVELGKEIEDALATIHSKYDTECIVGIRKEFLNQVAWEQGMAMLGRKAEWDQYKNYVIIYHSPLTETGLYDKFIMEQSFSSLSPVETDINNSTWQAVAHPLQDVSGKSVGKLVLINNISQQRASFDSLITKISGGTLAALGLLFAYLFISLRKTDQVLLTQKNKLIQNKNQIGRYVKAIDNMGIGLLLIDEDFCIRECNDTLKKWFGEPNGKLCHQWIFGLNSPCSYCQLKDVIIFRKTAFFQAPLSDGRAFEITSTPVTNPDGTTSMMEALNDVTLRKRAEDQLRKIDRLESIGTLAGGIAHDFNNVLAGIYGNIALANRKLDREHPAFKSLTRAEKSLERATNLTNKLLTFAKGGEPITDFVNLAEIIQEVVNFDLTGSNVKLVFNQASDLWTAKVDKSQIQQLFSNLAVNALQSMPEGGHLYISLQNHEIQKTAVTQLNPGKYINITVRDEGCGIEQDHLKKIFDLYFSTKPAGCGLGLATVYSIVTKHHGHIEAQSEVGKGTTLTIDLPANKNVLVHEEPELELEDQNPQLSLRVLVMDDEEIIRTLISDILKGFGCTVETATNGDEAIRLYQQALHEQTKFDIAIFDLTVPGGVGGKEAIQKLLQIDSQAKVIVSSGYADDPVLAHYSDYGFKDFLVKPFTIKKIQDVIEKNIV